MSEDQASLTERLKRIVIGAARKPTEPGVFHKVSLVAFLAWVGLGSDGISSVNYGPQEAFLALQGHTYLALFLAVMTALTVFVISASYTQIIELFPSGGGGYTVVSKLLSPTLGMVAGCALVIDYILTITVSVASGADAIFSFLPLEWHHYKLPFAFLVLLILTVLNLRGVRESVLPLVPIFILFVSLHALAILYGLVSHGTDLPELFRQTSQELQVSTVEMGTLGVLLLLLHAYSLGGGTYTGIEAVSNALPVLREPRVETGKRTMLYMAVSLAFIAGGLILAYLLFDIRPQPGKTLNAALFERVASEVFGDGQVLVVTALVTAALILFVAAQTGFLGGPRVLANMALDGWMPTRFAVLSDRLVTQNGILLMSGVSLILMWVSRGSVSFLVVLYSINVFLTFSLSQLGMVKHWWEVRHREPAWVQRIMINGLGFLLTSFILATTTVVKFHEGGWLTLVITTSLILLATLIRRHYARTRRLLQRLDALLTAALPTHPNHTTPAPATSNAHGWDVTAENTAVILVNGFNGLGLHTLFTVLRIFRGHFKNFVFLQVGVIDAGRFKGIEEIENLRRAVSEDLNRYVELMRAYGYHAESVYALGTDVVDEVEKLALETVERFPHSVLFAGQLVFPRESMVTRILHNYTSFAIQRRLYHRGIPVLILPVRV